MTGSYRFQIECPHCGFKQFTVSELINIINRPQGEFSEIITCDPDEGGCDQDFAIKWKLSPTYKLYKLVAPD